MKRWATWPVGALVLFVLVAAGAIGYAIHHERGVKPTSFTDAVKNQRILDQLTPYPGSRQTGKFVRRSYGGYGQGLIPGQEARSHSTTVVYSLPAPTKRPRIAAFYAKQLRGWERNQDEVPCARIGPGGPCPGLLFATFVKGDAQIRLDFEGASRGKRKSTSFSVVVDHQGATSGGYYSGD